MRKRVSFILHLDVSSECDHDALCVQLAEELQVNHNGKICMAEFLEYLELEWVSNGQDFGDPPNVNNVVKTELMAVGYEYKCLRCGCLNKTIASPGEGVILQCANCRQKHEITGELHCHE